MLVILCGGAITGVAATRLLRGTRSLLAPAVYGPTGMGARGSPERGGGGSFGPLTVNRETRVGLDGAGRGIPRGPGRHRRPGWRGRAAEAFLFLDLFAPARFLPARRR
jgi:hypothetical protein